MNSENSEAQAQAYRPSFNDGLFRSGKSVLAVEEITELSEQHKKDFWAYMAKPEFANRPKYERLANYLSLLMADFEYTEQTNTAKQTMDKRGGNCLSLALLTTAFAELAMVNISYQLLENNPVYSVENNLLITSDHLRAVLKGGKELDESQLFSLQRNIRIDFFPTDGLKYIDDLDAELQISMYYSNVAAELISADEYDAAFHHALKALDVYSDNASALNSLGVLHRRKGDMATAEAIYQFGMKQSKRSLMFLRNYSYLLDSQSRKEDSEKLLKNIPSNKHDHPWQWIRAGRLAHQKGQLDKAIPFYERALSLAPDLHQVHLYTASAYYQAGDKLMTRHHLQQAVELAKAPKERQRYSQKLLALQ